MKRLMLLLTVALLGSTHLYAAEKKAVLAQIQLFKKQLTTQKKATDDAAIALLTQAEAGDQGGWGRRDVQSIEGDISSEMLSSQLVQDMIPFFHTARKNLNTIAGQLQAIGAARRSELINHQEGKSAFLSHLITETDQLASRLSRSHSRLTPEQALSQLYLLKQNSYPAPDTSYYDAEEKVLREKYTLAKQELDKWHNDIKTVLLEPAKRQHEKEMAEANMMTDVMKAREAAKAKAIEDNKHYAAHSKQNHEQRIAMSKLLLGGGTTAILASILGYYLTRHYFTPRPTIIERNDTSMLSRLERLRGLKVPPSNLQNLVLSPELSQKITGTFDGIGNAIREGFPLSNMLFHGPAGTGKTMAAQAFDRNLHEQGLAHHVIVRGGAFKRLGSAGAAQKALTDILRWARTSDRPVIIVFDEAETMFVDRESDKANEVTRELTVALLSFFERAVNSNMMFILCSNLPHLLDRALLNRIDPSNRVKFTTPGHAELVELLKVYFNEHLTKNKFIVPESVMNQLPELAKRMHGAVGRQVDSFAAQLVYPMLNAKTKTLKPSMIDQILEQQEMTSELAAY